MTSNEINGNELRSSNSSQRRLHSVSSYPHEQSLSHMRPNEIDYDRLEQDFVRECSSVLITSRTGF